MGYGKMQQYGIVIIGYKNVVGIKRLLSSLDRVDFDGDSNVTLVISIDYSGDPSVEQVANAYEWKHGKKYVNAYQTNQGLRKHILSCGNYMEQYDLSAVAVLEDDIYVSPEMYKYMKASVEYYGGDPRIAGISLYKHEVNINAKHPFIDYNDGGDTYFMQYAMSWGQIWMREKWADFRKWNEEEQWKNLDPKRVPRNVYQWKNSWLKFHIMYCIEQNKYFVYPRHALSTNFTDVGTHNSVSVTSMQIPMCMEKKETWSFSDLESSNAVYDAFFENIKIANYIQLENVEIDLYGVKEYQSDTRYALTRKVLPNKIVKSWGLKFRPIEANIYLDMPGEDLFLYDLRVTEKPRDSKTHRDVCFEYDLKGINLLCMENVRYCIQNIVRYVQMKIRRKKKK